MEEKNYIEGIYNYCDRWCEKCLFTSRCLLFTNESKFTTLEILNNYDISSIKEIFTEIDDEETSEEDDAETFFNNDDDDIEGESFNDDDEDYDISSHPLDILAGKYFNQAHAFIKRLEERFKFFTSAKTILDDPEFKLLSDNYDTISWFHAFIRAKLVRALSGKVELFKEEDEELREITQYDIDGSAKIAIIAIQRSIQALNFMINTLPEYHEEISELLVIAGEMLNIAEVEFPGYKSFIRPGLDKE